MPTRPVFSFNKISARPVCASAADTLAYPLRPFPNTTTTIHMRTTYHPQPQTPHQQHTHSVHTRAQYPPVPASASATTSSPPLPHPPSHFRASDVHDHDHHASASSSRVAVCTHPDQTRRSLGWRGRCWRHSCWPWRPGLVSCTTADGVRAAIASSFVRSGWSE